jgi:hypothetical protein
MTRLLLLSVLPVIVEIEPNGNRVIASPMALRAANPTVVRIRRRRDA